MVVLIEKTSTLKIAILATLTLLTITSASALTWEAPQSPVSGTVTLNVSVDSEYEGNAVVFEYQDSDGNWNSIDDSADSTGGYANTSWSTGNPGSGDYTVRANVTGGGPSETKELTVDNSLPSISVPIEDGERLNESSAEFEISASDSHTALTEFQVTLENPNGNGIYSTTKECDGQECSVSPDFVSELEHNTEYTLEVSISDQVGQTDSENINFIYDNKYEGDEEPEISPQPKVFKTSPDTGEYTFGIDLEQQDPAEPSEISVTCEYGDQSVSAGTKDVTEDGASYSCDIEPMRNARAPIEVIMTDEAGNSASKEFDYTFDYDKPVVENASTAVSVFNSDFEVDYDSYDSASDVNGLIYQVDDSTLDTDGEVLDANGSFTVDTSDLGSGSHTLYVWVRDEADRWSEADSLTFDYRPDATPQASVSGLGEFRVTAGKSKEFSFRVVNTGKLMIPSLTLKLDTGFSNHTSIVSDLMPEENRSVSFTVDTEESNLGTHEVSLTSENPDISESFQMVVEANSDQQENISQRYQSRFNEFEDLRSNVTELLNKVSDERQRKLRNDFSKLNETMNQAQKAVDEGRYYEADKLLEGIGSQFSEARQGYDEVREDHQIAQRNKFIFGFLLFAVVIGGGAVGFFYMNEDYEFDISAIEDLEFGRIGDVSLGSYSLSMEPVENFIERIKEFLEEEEEKAEDAFQGFTN